MATAVGSYATASALKARLGITDTTDDAVLGSICDQVNAYIEQRTRRVLAPIASATYLYDGDGTSSLYLPFPATSPPIGGIRAATLVEVADTTGGAYVSLASTDWALRQIVGMTGPYERLLLTGTGAYARWPEGLATVRVTGTAGWAVIPDDIVEVALTAATRAWHSAGAGQQDIVGSTETGAPVVSRFFSARDLGTLNDYRAGTP